MIDSIKEALVLYSLNLIWVAAVSIYFFSAWVLDVKLIITYFEFISNYFYSGTLFGIIAWRFHLLGLIFCSLISILDGRFR